MTDVRPLECTSVGKRFPQGARAVHALAGIDLTIEPGEFVAVMGASGSGKSTLLHALAGLCDVDEGSIRIEGRELGGMGDAELTRFRRERIGIVFQAFNLIPTLSALDNVLLPAMDRVAASRGARDWLTRLGLADRMDHKPDALSGGEQQRVAIARALRGNPAILLLDEPTGSLDSVAGQELCELLAEIRRQKPISIVMVTHEADVARWADRVVVLKDGRVVAGFDCGAGVDAQELGARYRECLA